MSRQFYHYDKTLGKVVPGRAPSRSDPSGDGWRYSDRLYSASPFTAHDGTVIDSKKKHRDYMSRHGLTTADDFAGSWSQAAKMREQIARGEHDRASRAKAIAAAIDRHTQGKR